MNTLRFPANECFCKIYMNFCKDDKTPNKDCFTGYNLELGSLSLITNHTHQYYLAGFARLSQILL